MSFEVKLKRWARNLRQMDRRVDDVSDVFDTMEPFMVSEFTRNFSSRGQYFGTSWRPLSYRTLQNRASSNSRTMHPLYRTGKLFQSFAGPNNIFKTTSSAFVFGSRDPKAAWHHYGTHRNGKPHIPPRVLFKITRQMKREALSRVRRYVLTGRLSA